MAYKERYGEITIYFIFINKDRGIIYLFNRIIMFLYSLLLVFLYLIFLNNNFLFLIYDNKYIYIFPYYNNLIKFYKEYILIC